MSAPDYGDTGCHLCGKEVDPAGAFCYGCGVNICDDCDVEITAGHGHEPEDHLGCLG